jgi:hypothetical protein
VGIGADARIVGFFDAEEVVDGDWAGSGGLLSESNGTCQKKKCGENGQTKVHADNSGRDEDEKSLAECITGVVAGGDGWGVALRGPGERGAGLRRPPLQRRWCWIVLVARLKKISLGLIFLLHAGAGIVFFRK